MGSHSESRARSFLTRPLALITSRVDEPEPDAQMLNVPAKNAPWV